VWALDLLAAGRPVAYFNEEAGPEQIAEKLIALGAGSTAVAQLHYFRIPGRGWSACKANGGLDWPTVMQWLSRRYAAP